MNDAKKKSNFKRDILLFVVPAIILILLVGVVVIPHVIAPKEPQVYSGSLFVSDAGQSHGGFEYTASWDAVMKISGKAGVLDLTLNVGLGDVLTKHHFNITQFALDPSTKQLSFVIDGIPISMVNLAHDQIWNGTYDGYYVASWGGYAPAEEKIGSIAPSAFPGVADFWYIELRLR